MIKKSCRIITAVVIFLAAALMITFIPTFNLKTSKMVHKETDNFVLYYEKQDEKAAKDMAEIFEKTYEAINSAMDLAGLKKRKYIFSPTIKLLRQKNMVIWA